jgi:charged multivesicular body protein 6
MLEGNLTNQDEDDVEEELEALQRETQPNVVPKLPNAPNNKLPTPEEAEVEGPAEPTRSKTKTRTAALAA